MYREKITAQNKEHLKKIIDREMLIFGTECDLNHVDISLVKDLSELFKESEFNGNISKWNVSHVVNMEHLFNDSKFNGDISNWDTSNVENMHAMFLNNRHFTGRIDFWNTSKVTNMGFMFCNSIFNGDISRWMFLKLFIWILCLKTLFLINILVGGM